MLTCAEPKTMWLGQVLLGFTLGFGTENGPKKISTVGTLSSRHSRILVEKQLLSEQWEQPLILASRARNVDSAERRHGQHEPKPGHIQKSSAGGRPATVGVYFSGGSHHCSQVLLLVSFQKTRLTHARSSCFWRVDGVLTVETLPIKRCNGVGCCRALT